MRQYSLSFNSLIGSFIDAPTRRVAGAQWGWMHTRKQKKRTDAKKMQKSRVKSKKRKKWENYQVASASELFFVDLNGRIILIRSHCYFGSRGELEEKENFVIFRGEGGGKRTGGGRAEYPLK